MTLTKGDHFVYTLFILTGNNLYMLGSQPSEIDAVMFGFLAQIKWQTNQNSPIAVALNCKLMLLNGLFSFGIFLALHPICPVIHQAGNDLFIRFLLELFHGLCLCY